MNILFTGHKGFLGRELIPNLIDKHNVVIYEGDCRDRIKLQEFVREKSVDRIIHAAVKGGRRNKVDTPETLVNNVSSSINCLEIGIPTLLFCSGAVYDRSISINNAPEASSGNSYPEDFYGQSKFIVNQMAKNYTNSTVFRFFNVFGKSEGLDRFISANLVNYIQHKPMTIFNDFYMDFFFVEDVIPLLDLWLSSGNLPVEMNLVYPEKYLLSEICEFINGLSDYKVGISYSGDRLEKNYSGDATLLNNLNLKLQGLHTGVVKMYRHFLEDY